MKLNRFILALTLWSTLSYSLAQIPAGEIRGPFVWKSIIYPGTERNYWIYVPVQYDASSPACLMVVQDGLSRAKGWKLPAVMDSLIAGRKIPVMIGVFIDHGTVSAVSKDYYPRYNRSFEYDALGDRYARFLMEEILPEVSRTYNISTNPNDRSIGGASSGAICAFNVAWERPDQFRRVLSTIGTYVGLRGGDEFATLVRKTEPKPLRVFLEDGTKDLNIYGGDWSIANLNMLSALTYAGYEVDHRWGEGGGHESKHAITIMAEALEWLWKDYPAPVQTHVANARINLLIAGEDWNEIPLKGMRAGGLAINKNGDVYFSSGEAIYKEDNGDVTLFVKLKGTVGGLSFHQDGHLYVADLTNHKIVSIDGAGALHDVVTNVNADFITLADKGIYFTDTKKERIGVYIFSTKHVQYTALSFQPTGLALTADQSFLNVGTSDQVFGYSFKVQESGSLDFGQAYVHYHIPYGEATPGVSGMCVDSDNLLYSATKMGVQVSDQLGRVNFIFSQPATGATDVKLGGKTMSTLCAIYDGKLYSRKISAKATLSCLPPVKPPKPGL